MFIGYCIGLLQIINKPQSIMRYKLYLGNQTYSSWSLRVWMLLRAFGIDFEYEVVPLYTDDFEEFRKRQFPAKAVPVLTVGKEQDSTIIWDSLSITEFLHEHHPKIGIWPAEPMQRATARSLSAEMHSGFNAIRSTMPMNLKRRYKYFTPTSATLSDIKRMESLWAWARAKHGQSGPYLFGEKFTAVDAFFTPVAERFRTYSIDTTAETGEYINTLLNHPSAIEFHDAAQSEAWVMEHNEFEDQ